MISLKLHNLNYSSRKNENLNSQPKKKRKIQTKSRDSIKNQVVIVLLRPIVKNAVLVVLSKVVLPNYLRKLMKLFNKERWKSQKWKIKVLKTVERLFKQNLKWKNVNNFRLVQTIEEKTKTETIVGQLTPSGNSYCIDKGGLISESFSKNGSKFLFRVFSLLVDSAEESDLAPFIWDLSKSGKLFQIKPNVWFRVFRLFWSIFFMRCKVCW
jgi:hypothetical protein